MQKLKCPKCGRILGGKAKTKKNGKSYFYYYCTDCKIEFKEKLINDYFTQFIAESIEYDEIVNLKSELSAKDKIINELQAEKEKLKTELQKFKEFWHKLIKHFQNKIDFNKYEKNKYVSDDLYKNGIFDDNDNRIVNDVSRKVRPADELNNINIRKKNNMELK